MKRFISIALTLVMLVSVFTVTAYAANNGPIGSSPMYMRFVSGISLLDTDGKGTIKTEYDEDYGYDRQVGVNIYDKDGVHNISGVTYDKDSNTLTLSNLKAADKVLCYYAMGDDFKLNVEGECSLAAIQASAYSWSAGVAFTGSGTLTVNADKAFEYGLQISSYYASSPVTFGANVKVRISGKEKAAAVFTSNAESASKQIMFQGKSNAKVETEKLYDERREFAEGFYIDQTLDPDYIGPRADCSTDPDGVYVMGNMTSTDSDGNVRKGHWVKKLVYSKSLGLYIPDPSFGTKSLYPEDEEYDDFEDADSTLYNTEKRYVDAYLYSYTDDNGKKYYYGDVYDNGNTKIVATVSNVSDVEGAKLFTEYKTGEEAEEFVETLTKDPMELVPIGGNQYRDKSQVYGFFLRELDMDRDHLGVQVKSKSDPDGLYFMSWGTRYENWGTDDQKSIPAHWVKKYVYLDKQKAYVPDESFEEMTFDYDSIKDSDFTPLSGSFSDDDDYDDHTYNNGKIKHIYGYFYEDKNGKRFIVDDIEIDGDYVNTAFNYEEIPQLSDSKDKKYICEIAEGVDADKLSEIVEKIEIEGIHNYYIGTADFVFDGSNMNEPPAQTDISKFKAKLAKTAYTYTGKAIKPAVTVSGLKSSDYTVTYKNNKNVGTAAVTITGKDAYKGTIKKTFTINPKSTSLKKVTPKKKALAVSWTKNTTQTTGYQLQYSLNSSFKSAKMLNVKKNKTASATISSLKANKKYYVRIRTYTTVSKKNYYSDWSKAKSAATKK